MHRHLFATAAACLLASVAHAAPATPSYAAISLVGDKLDVVTYQPRVGSQLDSNSHMPLRLTEDALDTTALRTIGQSLRELAPGVPVALLAASTPDSFADQDRIFSGSHVTLPAEIDAAVHREGATMLVLVTKRHAEARLRSLNGDLGSGTLDGLGYYLDSNKRLKNRDTGVRSIGFLAPFAYVEVSLVDLATSTVVRQAAITSGYVIGASDNGGAVNPWDALNGEQKVARLESLLSGELQRVLPALIKGEPSKTD